MMVSTTFKKSVKGIMDFLIKDMQLFEKIEKTPVLTVFMIVGSVLMLSVFLTLVFSGFEHLFTVISYKKNKNKDIETIDKMDQELFVEYMAALFYENKYKIKKTDHSGYYGADLIIYGKTFKNRSKTRKNKIAVKISQTDQKLELCEIQQALAAQKFYKADEAWVVTNSTFSQASELFAKAIGVKLIDRKELCKIIYKTNKNKDV